MGTKTFNTLEINRAEGIIKIDGEQIPENATELNLHISGTDCRLEVSLEYSGVRRKWKGNAKSEKKMDKYTTKELIEEIAKREGVKKIIAEPYNDVAIRVKGPAVILVVLD